MPPVGLGLEGVVGTTTSPLQSLQGAGGITTAFSVLTLLVLWVLPQALRERASTASISVGFVRVFIIIFSFFHFCLFWLHPELQEFHYSSNRNPHARRSGGGHFSYFYE